MSASAYLHIASNISNDFRSRDRMLKILQYSCTVLALHGVKRAKDARYTLSTARKAFWLFRSVCHLQDLVISNAKEYTSTGLACQVTAHADVLGQISSVSTQI